MTADGPTLLLPLRLSDDAYGARQAWHARLLFRSLALRWQGAPPALAVAAPAPLLEATRSFLAEAAPGLAATLLADEALVPSPAFARLPGWFRQMAVKLGFARHCATRFYLTLDADVVLLRPAGAASLRPQGRALTQWEPLSWHPEWWRAAAAMLGLPAPPCDTGLSVTPNMLSTRIARRTLDLIEAAQRRPWDAALSETGGHATCPWTEYSLYTLGGLAAGWLALDHWSAAEATEARLPRLFGDNCIWGDYNQDVLDDLIAGRRLRARLGSGLFFVFQSTMPFDTVAHGEAVARSLLGGTG